MNRRSFLSSLAALPGLGFLDRSPIGLSKGYPPPGALPPPLDPLAFDAFVREQLTMVAQATGVPYDELVSEPRIGDACDECRV